MSKLVALNHEALHRIADPVPLDEITSPQIKKVLKDMREALHAYNVEGFSGVAIAAPQIGVPLRIFYIEDMGPKRKDEVKLPTLVAINPEIVKLSKKKEIVGEGCLSVGEAYGAVLRATRATIRAYDEEGNRYERGGSGLLAQIFQHECDHLDGILFTDKATEVWERLDEKNVITKEKKK